LCNTHLIASHVEAGIAKTGQRAAAAQKDTVFSIPSADIVAGADGDLVRCGLGKPDRVDRDIERSA
jgi:hypothetical protein